jgi:hypothetical protein
MNSLIQLNNSTTADHTHAHLRRVFTGGSGRCPSASPVEKRAVWRERR